MLPSLPPPLARSCSTGICTFDPGFGSTASCESSITYIDGNKGVLLYRGCAPCGLLWRQHARPLHLGPRRRCPCPPLPLPPLTDTPKPHALHHTLPPSSYPIEELAAEGDFIDSTFLLLHGELPSKQVRAAWLWLVGAGFTERGCLEPARLPRAKPRCA